MRDARARRNRTTYRTAATPARRRPAGCPADDRPRTDRRGRRSTGRLLRASRAGNEARSSSGPLRRPLDVVHRGGDGRPHEQPQTLARPGWRNAWILTSLGISCAERRADASSAAATSSTTAIGFTARRSVLQGQVSLYSLASCGPGGAADAPCASSSRLLLGARPLRGARRSVRRGDAGTNAGPRYQVDPWWPRPFTNQSWVLGSVTGVTVDAQNHVWVVHRGGDSLETNEKGMMLTPPSAGLCCQAAPFVLEFDQKGVLVSNWGGPGTGYAWPQSPGSLAVDAKGNVWIAAAGLEAATDNTRARTRRCRRRRSAGSGSRTRAAAGHRRVRRTHTCSSSHATASSCCRSARRARWTAPTARRR